MYKTRHKFTKNKRLDKKETTMHSTHGPPKLSVGRYKTSSCVPHPVWSADQTCRLLSQILFPPDVPARVTSV